MNYPISRLFFSLLMALFANPLLAEFADIQRIYKQTPSLNQLEICHGNGCVRLSQLTLTQKKWEAILAPLNLTVQNAKAERALIANAIGLLESEVGERIGTHADLAGTFHNRPGQMDCNDESINTTTYMRLLKQHGYIRFHDIEDLETRNFFFNGWPHTTAVIREIQTGAQFAVDSWFYDNGHRATIVPIDVWEDGYQPADSPIGKPRKD